MPSMQGDQGQAYLYSAAEGQTESTDNGDHCSVRCSEPPHGPPSQGLFVSLRHPTELSLCSLQVSCSGSWTISGGHAP